ncbi:hypothetical protein FACS189413_08010 [Bacteroidia bacterium]|nr:hypothetical protein FACS189413_08010 [Bacteroidia bacterium]
MKYQKTHKLLFALCLIAGFQFSTYAQTTHNIYLGAAGGYSSFLLKDAPGFTAPGSWGGGFEAGYELNARAFILKFGAECTYLNAGLDFKNFTQQVDLIDDDNPSEPYTGNYAFSGNSDRYRFANINIPLMLGFRVQRFYLLAGGKVGFNLFSRNTTTTTVLSTGTYPGFIDDFENMPNHSFLEITEKNKFTGKFPLNAYLSGEIGFYLGANPANNTKYRVATPGNKTKFRVAAFADYGLMNLRGNTINESLTLERENVASPYRPYLNGFIRSENMRGSVLNNLFVGLRFTVLFGFERQQSCGCNSDYE